MFNFFHKNQDRDIGLLIDQSIGGQSAVFRFLQDTLKVPEEKIKKKELTYFALAALSYVYLRLSKLKNKEDLLDRASLQVLQKSIPYCGEDISIKQVAMEYRERYKDYDKLINLLFKEDGGIDSDSCTTLLMYMYQKITLDSIEGKMIAITIASPLMAQYIIDNVDFVNKKILL